MNIKEINVLVLAYLGDTIYEDYIRKYLINKGIGNVNDLQKEALNYVSAKGQAKYINEMLDNNFFSEEELSIIKRARNNSSKSHPKNCDVVTYRYATALEALIGYLELSQNKERIDEIMNYILGE
ncbi:MAG: ribonuclease III [Bacilli bacterium]|nr:ribonuclease III [Bacilli bacterium]